MSKIDDGGPAFPRPASEYTKNGTLSDGNDAIDPQGGMSIRDFFAAKALEAILFERGSYIGFEEKAESAYRWADAMLAARKAVKP